MAKIQIKSEKLTPFGGIFSIMEKFDSMLSPVIDLYFPLALLTTTTLVEPERLCFLRTYMVQRYTFFACATQTTQ